MAKPYLELTKLQRELVFDMIRNQGYAEGVHTLYQRLRRIFGNRPHPAMNKKGEIAYKDDGGIYELDPRDEDSYEYNGDKYEYKTREVTIYKGRDKKHALDTGKSKVRKVVRAVKGVTNTYVFLSYHSGMCPHGRERIAHRDPNWS